MRIVVDASVAIRWFVEAEGSDRARRLGEVQLAAPELIAAEVANALWRYVAAGQIGRNQAAEAAHGLGRTIDEFHSLMPLAARALDVACSLGHPAYDCYYLALAERLGTRVVTADRRLAGKVAGTPFASLVELL